MQAIRFHTVIGEDQIIRPPQGLELLPGHAEVIVLRPEQPSKPANPSQLSLIERLARIAEESGIRGLPSDLAENHDHYIHGTSKGIDES